MTESDIQMARYVVGYVPNSVNVCVIGAPRSGKSSIAQNVLGPLVEGLAPLPITVAIENPNVNR